ncbi:alpha-E domain-containing protein [Methylacidiphilum sp. Yel]|uniref:alpha-E domain-containing protein n=1 Tax=Methylacidiphilum sp. Yel TaxID=1847730 RepID=UPI00106BCA2E
MYLFFLLFDCENPLSALSSLFSARENAKILRDILPVALWEQLNEAIFFFLRPQSLRVCNLLIIH